MTPQNLLAALAWVTTGEKITSLELESTELAQTKKELQQDKFTKLEAIGASRNLETIVAAEKFLIDFDLKEHANSKNMVSSLTTAREELEAIETNIGLVGDPKRYKEIDTSHVQRKVRDSSDLPLDSARIAFRSHNARLVNYGKARSDDHEKALIQVRQQNIKIAEKLYIGRQEMALGREAEAPLRPKTRSSRTVAFEIDSPTEAVKKYPELAPAFALVRACEAKAEADGLNPQQRAVVVARVRQNVAEQIERGEVPQVAIREKHEIKAEPNRDLER